MEKINFQDLPNTSTPINATNLNAIQTNTENAINGVVESGSNENGKWIKFSDGTMVVDKVVPLQSIDISSQRGSMYIGMGYLGDSPIAFTDIPRVYATNNGPAATFIYYIDSMTETNLGNIGVSRPSSGSASIIFSVLAIGRWK